jgi:hypothetical protein
MSFGDRIEYAKWIKYKAYVYVSYKKLFLSLYIILYLSLVATLLPSIELTYAIINNSWGM